MSGTMSSASSDWLQFYQHSEQPPSKAEVGWSGEPATTTTTITITAVNNITSTNYPPQSGRVSKPNPRRRSRASRRTPTTLLSTDTTNFRAMVQQFTGAGQTAPPPPPFISTNDSTNQLLGSTYSNNDSANLNFGLGPTSSMVAPLPPPVGAYSVQFRQPQDGAGGGVDQHQQYYVSSSGNNTNAQHQAFVQTLQNYASAAREGSRDVGPTTQGEDNNYMF